jgi:hypothetical protein
LVKTGRISNLTNVHVGFDGLTFYACPFGVSIQRVNRGKLKVAMAHEYRWMPGYNYQDASPKARLKSKQTDALGYDVIVYGDNHRGFLWKTKSTTVFNCGTLMRRHSDEMAYRPQVGLLTRAGEMKAYHLDTSQDKYLDTVDGNMVEPEDFDMTGFVQELEKLGEAAMDFSKAIQAYMDKHDVRKPVRRIIEKALEKK